MENSDVKNQNLAGPIKANRRSFRKQGHESEPSGANRPGGGSEMNALGHGLSAGKSVIKTKYYEESEEDFNNILRELRSSCAPQGALEEEIVRGLAFDVHCARRGELYENAVLRRNEQEAIRRLEAELGIPDLKENIHDAEAQSESVGRLAKSLSLLRDDFAQGTDFDFGKHHDALKFLYEKMWACGDLCVKMLLERAWRLERFHLLIKEDKLSQGPAAAFCQDVVTDIERHMGKKNADVIRMYKELKQKQKEFNRRMPEETMRCLVPHKEDLERLDRFYSMRDRRTAKRFELLARVQCARHNGAQLIVAKSLPGHSCSNAIESSAPSSPQSTTKEDTDHVS
ncbi:MAG: hypothetical protein ABSE41_14605 [Bacteroidota bacterium]|jgi:hypothetical protein